MTSHSPSPSSPSAPATPEALRAALVDGLVRGGWLRTASVEDAFRRVPRHRFMPDGTGLEAAYADDVVATRRTPEGQVTSAVSAPWLQADMLEAACLRPGGHVLEIGSGGFNAALAAEVVGPEGSVTTVDIDPLVTEHARQCLDATGYGGRVRVLTADAEHLPRNAVPARGFDAVIVTVGTWDVPWLDLVADGGRLIAPLRIHQYTWSMAFTKRGGALVTDGQLTSCGFLPMQGAGAWDAAVRVLPRHGVRLAFEDGVPQPVEELAETFDGPSAQVRTHVTVGGQEPFDALTLYLAGALPGFCRFSVDPGHASGAIGRPPPPHWPGAAVVRGASLARLTTERVGEDRDGGVHEFVVHGHGPDGRRTAEDMALHVQHWDRRHRTAGYPRITVRPRGDGVPDPDAAHVFEKAHTRVVVDWSAAAPAPAPDPASAPAAREPEHGAPRDRSIVGAHLVLVRDDGAVLLGLRHADCAFAPSTWQLPAGHREQGESALACTIREAYEETGVVVDARDLTLVHTQDLLDPDSPISRLNLFFRATSWTGSPQLREPHHCTEWRFWPLAALPEPLVDYTRTALTAIARGEPYTHLGWPG
ncbi:methyltransferase, FxLD system [Streptomyces sp. Da 82-17]|uniref:methyltransferase, FxLD system n=1 Tax=Streptomyces sp. Da 82-17 TaxID=3377116 RepID=UPI0038D512F3